MNTMNPELLHLIDSIREIPLNDRLSDDAVIALSRSYVSMQNLVVANGMEPTYGNRKEFEKALDILYRICRQRCRYSQPFARRSRMTPVLYMIVYMQMYGVALQKSRECEELMSNLVNEWMRCLETHAERTAVYSVLRCISNLFCYVSEHDRENDLNFLWFKQRIGDWAVTVSGAGKWDGISASEALCRIEVMSRNANMFLDTSNDEVIEQVRTSYCKSILGQLHRSNGKPLRNYGLTLFMLYEVMMWGISPVNNEIINAIARCAIRLVTQYPQGSDEWLLYQSTILDWLCMQVTAEIQNQMSTNIA